ncbi:MAG: hypothetical protein QOG51_1657 [Verrucomicrobiota bacterium]|jgi:hypothetical protein
MNVLIRTPKAVAIIICGFAVVALAESSPPAPTKTKIYQIDAVKLTVSGAGKIKVSATGSVSTGGWTGSQLVPSATHKEKAENPDAVTLHFDFVATKPTGIVTTVITPIGAETTCSAPGAGKTLKVIVHSETNQKADSIKSPNDPR